MRELLVIGGSTYDITAKILGVPVPFDSNPATIYTGCGGVGRNIAENAARMGLGTGFISAFGTDAFSRELIASCEAVGMDLSRACVTEDAGACVYLSILDANGELQYAASDLTPLERLAPERIAADRAYLAAFPTVCVDANNTEPMLEAIVSAVTGRVIADAVSVTKAPRLRAILPHIDALKVNRAELASLAERPTEDAAQVQNAAERLLALGVRRVIVTMGAQGSACFTADACYMQRALPVEVKNVTGAGDAFAAAVAYGLTRGYSDADLLRLGTAASCLALRSPFAINRELSEAVFLRTFSDTVFP